ncbi:MAG: MFS transporter, partial [Pseudomonadota bacterium]
IDAYRIEILTDQEMPYGSAMIQFGYRTGNLIAGAGTIYLATQFDWATAYAATALCVFFGAVAALMMGEPAKPQGHEAPTRGAQTTPLAAMGGWLYGAIITPFADFFRRQGLIGALLILCFVVIYKLGDAMGQEMLSPLIVDLGFSHEEYIWANKLVGFWALMVGISLGAPVIKLLGMGRALLWTGILMMVTNLVFAWLALVGYNPALLAFAVGFENFTSGMGLTVFITYLSGLCSVAYSATQYALLSALASLARTFLSAPSGVLVERLDWAAFYVLTTIVALPGLILLWLIWRRGLSDMPVQQEAPS